MGSSEVSTYLGAEAQGKTRTFGQRFYQTEFIFQCPGNVLLKSGMLNSISLFSTCRLAVGSHRGLFGSQGEKNQSDDVCSNC